jgi:hypothetical protein
MAGTRGSASRAGSGAEQSPMTRSENRRSAADGDGPPLVVKRAPGEPNRLSRRSRRSIRAPRECRLFRRAPTVEDAAPRALVRSPTRPAEPGRRHRYPGAAFAPLTSGFLAWSQAGLAGCSRAEPKRLEIEMSRRVFAPYSSLSGSGARVFVWPGPDPRLTGQHNTLICRYFDGSDGTRTRDLRRDRPVMALPA